MTTPNWKAQVTVGVVDVDQTPKQQSADIVDKLLAAGRIFDARTDQFAAGKGATCRDIAGKLAKYGEFASDAQANFAAKLIEWATPRAASTLSDEDAALVLALEGAARHYDGRSDAFAAGKGATCKDIAARAKNGGFASSKQREYAEKLVAWTSPRQPRVNAPRDDNNLKTPMLHTVMLKHSQFHVGALKVTRKNQDTLCWLVWNDMVIGRMDAGVTELWSGKAQRAGANLAEVKALVLELEANPLAAAQRYGKLSGRCCSCGLELTNDESIELGQGPICRAKFN